MNEIFKKQKRLLKYTNKIKKTKEIAKIYE